MSTPNCVYECGICGCFHPWNWDGDCRDDRNRFADVEEFATSRGINANDVKTFSMEDRVAEDLA
jgi:hypothetical protein